MVAVLNNAGQLSERVEYSPYGLARHYAISDFNGSGDSTTQDIFDFLNAWFAGAATADFNRSGLGPTQQDIFDFINTWFAVGSIPAGEVSSRAIADNLVGYCGYLFHKETQNYCVRFRHYSPGLGRWLERDPAGYVDGMGLYEYVQSQPLSYEDYLGLQATPMQPTTTQPNPAVPARPTPAPKSPQAPVPTIGAQPNPAEVVPNVYDKLEDKIMSLCAKVKMGGKDCKDPSKPASGHVCSRANCEREAKELADKIKMLWNNNCGNGNNRSKHNAGGYLCWDWARNFEKVVNNGKYKCFGAKVHELIHTDKNADGLCHYYTKCMSTEEARSMIAASDLMIHSWMEMPYTQSHLGLLRLIGRKVANYCPLWRMR